MIAFLLQLIPIIGNLLTLLIIINSVLSYFLPPYHPVRESLGRVLNPLYAPIRRLIPPLGMIDITPLILLVLIWVVESILVNLLLRLY